MIKNPSIRILFAFISLSFSQTPLFALENTAEYEGWVWAPTLKFQTPNKQEIDVEGIHREMKKVVMDDKSINGYAKREKEKEGKNVVVLRLGFLVKRKDGYNYQDTDCFKKMVFFSGSEESEEKAKDLLGLAKFGNYYKVEPTGYSFKPIDTQKELESRFSPEGILSTSISPTVYQKFSFRELSNPNLLSDNLSKASQPKPASLKKVIGDFGEKIFYLHDRHAHSEPKALFFLSKTMSSLPSYWSFQFEPVLNDAIELVRNFVLINHRLFSDEYVSLTMKDIQEEILNMDTRISIKNKIKLTEELAQSEGQKDLTQTKQPALARIRELRKILFDLNQIEITNPLNLELSDPNFFKINAYKALTTLEELLSRKPYMRFVDFEQDRQELTQLESALPYQDMERTGDENWIAGLIDSLSHVKVGEEVAEVILHWHSFYDICESCSPSIARECEQENGFVARLRSIIMARNPLTPHLPFRVITSCSKIRKGCEERFKSNTFNEWKKTPPLFTQTFLN